MLLGPAFLAHLMEPLVDRPRLRLALEREGVRLVLVAGAPGSGKSVLLRQWLGHLGHLGDLRRGWVDLDPGSSTDFWGAVLDSLGLAPGPVGIAMQRALKEGAGADAVVGPLVQHFAAGQEAPAALVLDNYEAVSDADVHGQLTRLVEHCPPGLRIAIATREDPPLPIGRWRVRGELAEVRDADLQFDRAEVEAMFPGYGSGVLDALAERTEGWAAGLRLAALAARRAAHPATLLENLDGNEPAIAQFLVEEALETQPADLRDFLLATSVVDAFDASLCDAMTGRTDGAASIARLVARHAFVVRADREDRPGRWFRYHRMFADVLREEAGRLSPDRTHPAQKRAAQWHAAQGEPEQAIALAIAAGDYGLALDQLLAHHFELSAHGKWLLVLGWLNSIPPAALARDPARALNYALVLCSSGRVEQGASVAAHVEARFRPGAPRHLRAAAAVVRAAEAVSRGDLDAFRQQAPGVDALLHDDDPAATPWALVRAWMLGLAGEFTPSLAGFADAGLPGRPLPRDIGDHGVALLSEVLALQGSLREADVHVRTVLLGWARAENTVQPPALCAALRAQAMLHLEAGRLDDAERVLLGALAAEENAPIPIERIMTVVLLAEVARARGRPEEALACILDARRPRGTQPIGSLLRTRLASARARAEIDLGQIADAARSVKDADLPGVAALLRARVALASGDRRAALPDLDEADRLLAADWLRRRVETQLLLARVYLESNPARARRHVDTALELGVPEGLLWTLAQEAELAPLYADATGRHPVPGLGALITNRATGPRQVMIDLVDEPSERELQVLSLLARGLSYQEVASELFLSRNTVKAHAQSVYRKIGAHSRAEATEQAIRMGLVEPVRRDLTPPG